MTVLSLPPHWSVGHGLGEDDCWIPPQFLNLHFFKQLSHPNVLHSLPGLDQGKFFPHHPFSLSYFMSIPAIINPQYIQTIYISIYHLYSSKNWAMKYNFPSSSFSIAP